MRSLRPSLGRTRVLAAAAGKVVVEHGNPAALGERPKLAVIAHFSDRPQVNRSVRTLLSELDQSGYGVLLVSASPADRPLDGNGELPASTVVVRQPNIGYDFGSWAIGLDLVADARRADHVILANDSMLGPFGSLSGLLGQFEATQADVWALTDTRQFCHHLQSYFLGFRGGILADRPLAAFWRNVRIEKSKWDVIRRNELGLSQLLRQEGYATTAAYRANDIVKSGDNPVIKGWSTLLNSGFPFLKREIVNRPEVAPMADSAAAEVERLYGQKLDEWL